MSIHIGAKRGEIAEAVLLPGDPVRAKYISDHFLEDVKCYSEVRGMLGFTGKYQGLPVSVQGAGMGIPSNAIYLRELIDEYNVKKIIRVGTCGAIREDIALGSVVIPMGASTDSGINRHTFGGMDFAPVPDLKLLNSALQVATRLGMEPLVGGVFSTDVYYNGDPDRWKVWSDHNVLVTEMESSVLFTYAAQAGIQALSVLSVSDSIPLGTHLSPEEREASIENITRIALETLKSLS